MKTKVEQTSLEAFRKIKPNLNKNEKIVYEVILDSGPVSDADIETILGWKINRVTGRRNALENKKEIVCIGKKLNKVTGMRVNIYQVRGANENRHKAKDT